MSSRQEPPEPRPRRPRRGPAPHEIHWGLRLVLLGVGWGLVLVGVAGLALPGIQGILTILAGAALLSLVSEFAHRQLRALLRRWPRAWRRVEKLRRKLHRKLRSEDPGDGTHGESS